MLYCSFVKYIVLLILYTIRFLRHLVHSHSTVLQNFEIFAAEKVKSSWIADKRGVASSGTQVCYNRWQIRGIWRVINQFKATASAVIATMDLYAEAIFMMKHYHFAGRFFPFLLFFLHNFSKVGTFKVLDYLIWIYVVPECIFCHFHYYDNYDTENHTEKIQPH